jgi:TRAP-type C4-dicarboxylate transport system permease small subunit
MSVVLGWIERLLNVLGAVLVAVILAAVCAQIVMRYVFNNATTWSDPVAASALVWLTFLVTAAAIRSDTNMSVRIAWKWLGPRGRRNAETMSQLLTAAFAICLGISAWQLMRVTVTATVEGLPFQMSWAQMYSITLLAGAFMIVFAVERILRAWAGSLQ